MKNKESLYSILAFVLMIISFTIGGVFYYSNMNTTRGKKMSPKITETPVSVGAESSEKVIEEPLPTIEPDQEYASTQNAELKIAVPNEASGILVNPNGQETGKQSETSIVNDIPFSEYSPDNIAGTVTWILVKNPVQGKYVLKVTGESDKAIAVYAVGHEGDEELELIDISSPASQEHSYFFDLNLEALDDMIVLAQE